MNPYVRAQLKQDSENNLVINKRKSCLEESTGCKKC